MLPAPRDLRVIREPEVLADVDKELALLGREMATVAAITTRQRPERVEIAAPVGVIPSLQGGHREGAGDVRTGWAEALLGESVQVRAQLAAGEVLARERADDLAAEAGHRLGMVHGGEQRRLRERCVHRGFLLAAARHALAALPRTLLHGRSFAN